MRFVQQAGIDWANETAAFLAVLSVYGTLWLTALAHQLEALVPTTSGWSERVRKSE